ncbi:UvrD-helicase domain-containing protein [Leucobacter albus]|uniref:UvrD-helicase domain-containing protein n=1 Tax=Leucobacter albus TaxID=272210 RepID=A0ABW3TLX2_9MICO
MPAEVRLAVAGSGKTSEIVRKISEQQQGTTSLALTFTQFAQSEIEARLPSTLASEHETMGWYAFLVRHIVRPFFPLLYPDKDLIPRGLCFIDSLGQIPKGRGGWKYYLNDQHQPYNLRLALLAKQVIKKTNGAPIERLQRIYDNIYIDEFQDLVGNDLEVVAALMDSEINLFMTGDVRQSVLETSRSDRLNEDYRGVKQVDWFRAKRDAGLCTLVPSDTTTRFNQAIADFSDLIHDPTLELPPTSSTQMEVTGHDGVFLVDESQLAEYLESLPRRATILWSQKSQRQLPQGELLTFGTAKGITRERVAILTTGPIVSLLKSRKLLKHSSASGFYVAVTRARYSVALVTKGAAKLHAQLHADFKGKINLWSS